MYVTTTIANVLMASNLFLVFSSDFKTPLTQLNILFLFALSFFYIEFHHFPPYLSIYTYLLDPIT